tara:strand:- start:5049 stop:5687 length:639 start_codon:yes stop_codon:yes gene_type:complete
MSIKKFREILQSNDFRDYHELICRKHSRGDEYFPDLVQDTFLILWNDKETHELNLADKRGPWYEKFINRRRELYDENEVFEFNALDVKKWISKQISFYALDFFKNRKEQLKGASLPTSKIKKTVPDTENTSKQSSTTTIEEALINDEETKDREKRYELCFELKLKEDEKEIMNFLVLDKKDEYIEIHGISEGTWRTRKFRVKNKMLECVHGK